MTWADIQEAAFGLLGLRPWELKEYSFTEFRRHMAGHAKKEAGEWDRTRHIMFSVFKAQGSKIKSVRDILQIPTIDKREDGEVRNHLLERLKERRKLNNV